MTRSPPAEGDRWRDLKLYALFAAFGGGASWFGTVLAFMEVPLYQRHFSGLELSNRLELGYNCGTVPAAAFLVALGVGWRASRRSACELGIVPASRKYPDRSVGRSVGREDRPTHWGVVHEHTPLPIPVFMDINSCS